MGWASVELLRAHTHILMHTCTLIHRHSLEEYTNKMQTFLLPCKSRCLPLRNNDNTVRILVFISSSQNIVGPCTMSIMKIHKLDHIKLPFEGDKKN